MSFLKSPSLSESVDQSKSQEYCNSLPSGSKLCEASNRADSPAFTFVGVVRFNTGAPLTTILAEDVSSPPPLFFTVKDTV